MQKTKFGFVIADTNEFQPLLDFAKKQNGEYYIKNKLHYVRFIINGCHEIIGVRCGIGKVNAAFAATALVLDENVDVIVNFGLSGGISSVRKGDIVIGTAFYEHDFDLSPLGYAPGKKPQDKSDYTHNEKITRNILARFPYIKEGVFVSGDRFVSSPELKEALYQTYRASCCDMESAAIAYVCYAADKEFISIRSVSDDADAFAADTYTKTNDLCETTLVELIAQFLEEPFLTE